MWIRQPTIRPQSDISTIGRRLRSRLDVACPASTDPRAIGSERKRSIAPLVRSWARPIATPKAPKTIVWAKMPPIRNSS